LATVQRGSNRLERLVNDLLLTAQLRAGQLDIQKTRADLVKIVHESVESARAQASSKALQMSLASSSAPIQVEADGVGLAQAHDGVISVVSEPDVGTSFAISLPLAEPFERQAPSGLHTTPLQV